MNLHEGRSLYRMKDAPKGSGIPTPAIPILGADNASVWRSALHWNETPDRGYYHGIFWTVNKFKTPGVRVMSNLDKILCWSADIDQGTKAEQSALIAKYPEPSAVIETKNGFHIYYNAVDPTIENYALIETKFVVPSLNADMNARDACRILRVPNFNHCKDPSNPTLVKLVHVSNAKYTEAQMMKCFKDHREPEPSEFEKKSKLKSALKFQADDGLWERVWKLNCEHGLERLSGTEAVRGERFDFKQNANGNKNIYVNNSGTSCFIDRDGHIGSTDGGGPSIFSWLKWYGHSNSEVVKILREHFPELFK